MEQLGLLRRLCYRGGTVMVRDLWTHTDLGVTADYVFADVPSHGVFLAKLTPAAASR